MLLMELSYKCSTRSTCSTSQTVLYILLHSIIHLCLFSFPHEQHDLWPSFTQVFNHNFHITLILHNLYIFVCIYIIVVYLLCKYNLFFCLFSSFRASVTEFVLFNMQQQHQVEAGSRRVPMRKNVVWELFCPELFAFCSSCYLNIFLFMFCVCVWWEQILCCIMTINLSLELWSGAQSPQRQCCC